MISVITTTWNREKLLKRLYDSLINQSSKNFEWVIVDDGSTDKTEAVVKEFIKEDKLNINYVKQQNGGKHRALNTAINEVKGEFCFIVDSDDYLTEDAISTIEKDCEKVKDKNISGVGYLRKTPNEEVIGAKYTKDEIVDNFTNQRYNNNTYGDKAEVYKTEVMREFKFPEYENEKFLSESAVWCKISEKYDMLFINKAIYVCDYQEGGLSDNIRKRLLNNPKGSCECYRVMCGKQFNLKNKLKHLILYICHGIAAGYSKKELKNGISCKFLFNLMYLPGKILYKKRKKKYQ